MRNLNKRLTDLEQRINPRPDPTIFVYFSDAGEHWYITQDGHRCELTAQELAERQKGRTVIHVNYAEKTPD